MRSWESSFPLKRWLAGSQHHGFGDTGMTVTGSDTNGTPLKGRSRLAAAHGRTSGRGWLSTRGGFDRYGRAASRRRCEEIAQFRMPVAAIVDQKGQQRLHAVHVRAIDDRAPFARAAQ